MMLKSFFHHEAAGGMVLMFAAVLALVAANGPLGETYSAFSGAAYHFVNDGLMAVFFFLVGLEIKREFAVGELSGRDRAILPVLAAAGGMVVPAMVYLAMNAGNPETMRGWAIPAATDIAFALGVLALLGSWVPPALKVLLTAIAIIDDLGAIAIIAVFYSHGLQLLPLGGALLALTGLYALNRRGIGHIPGYLLLGVMLWVTVYMSGLHATLAGVATAMFIPVRDPRDLADSPLERIEHRLHPYVVFGILPIFGFVNAGVSFAGMNLSSLLDPVTLGIILGLFLGKQAGIFLMLWAAIRCGLAAMPAGVSVRQLYGVALLCGIGFTMSLFIGALAFPDPEREAAVRLGVLAGSLLSALCGYIVLACGYKQPTKNLHS